MINFRFHLVSLTAVFLALALGIAVGATVVDQKTVSALRSQVNRVDHRLNSLSDENGRLRAQVGQWDAFGREEDGKGALVQGRLSGVHVLLIAARGTDADPLAKLRAALVSAGAALEGTIWLTPKLKLDPSNPSTSDDVRALAGDLGEGALDKADTARQAALHRLATSWAGSDTGTASNPLQAMVSDHFLDYEATPTGGLALSSVPQSGTMFVIVSSLAAEVPNDLVTIPFASELAQAAPIGCWRSSPPTSRPPLASRRCGPPSWAPCARVRPPQGGCRRSTRGRCWCTPESNWRPDVTGGTITAGHPGRIAPVARSSAPILYTLVLPASGVVRPTT